MVGTGFGRRAEPWGNLQPPPTGISPAAAMENLPQRGCVTPSSSLRRKELLQGLRGSRGKHPCKFPVCWLRTGFSFLIMDEKIRDNGWIYKQHFVMWGTHEKFRSLGSDFFPARNSQPSPHSQAAKCSARTWKKHSKEAPSL